jgi:nucleoid-associated protein YgaU
MNPLGSASSPLRPAVIEVLKPDNRKGEKIALKFNPTEYQLQKSNSFQEVPIPGLESPPIQFVRGASERLSVELLADTTDTLEDVRQAYVDPVRGLLSIDGDFHAPPIVRFVWEETGADRIFVGVLENLQTTFVLFSEQGVPLRARMSLAFKEYRTIGAQLKDLSLSSPDVQKSYVVRVGDTLASIATQAFKDPNRWRDIAQANGIVDPRRLEPGTALTIPRLR